MKAWIVTIGLLVSNVVYSAPTLLVNATGQLTGAEGVIVEGQSYDVRFRDGTCSATFGSCDVASFTFQTASSAFAAAVAILQTVLTDSSAGLFDTNPGLVFGCDPTSNSCNTLVPYAVNGPFVITGAVNNLKNEVDGDLATAFQFSFRPASFDSSTTPGVNFAVISLSAPVPAVPEAEAATLLFAGLSLLWLRVQHRRRTRAN